MKYQVISYDQLMHKKSMKYVVASAKLKSLFSSLTEKRFISYHANVYNSATALTFVLVDFIVLETVN